MSTKDTSRKAPSLHLAKTDRSRRRFLIGAGATLALPWLESLWPGRGYGAAMAQGAEFPKRFLGFLWSERTEGRETMCVGGLNGNDGFVCGRRALDRVSDPVQSAYKRPIVVYPRSPLGRAGPQAVPR